MTYAGEVRGGVVVLAGGVSLPDGTKVSVEPVGAEPDVAPTDAAKPDPAEEDPTEPDPLLGMLDLAVDTGIPDLAYNVDHYLYGHPRKAPPKASDGE